MMAEQSMAARFGGRQAMAGRRFAYNEQGHDHPVIVDEDQIRATYWTYWEGQMLAARARGQLNALNANIDWETCLEDFIVTNWAWEVDEEGAPIYYR